MAGGNLAAGISLVLAALIIHFLVAFMVSEGATTEPGLAGCSSTDNLTTCQDVSGSSFLSALLDITFTGFSGVPVVDGLYLLIVGGAFIAGIILIVAGITGTIAGGG